ncbi:hypothetical protein AAC387_Pa08g0625 [Persea americana]
MEYFSPRDAVRHGTHTASIAVGSLVHDVSFKGLALGTARGGAPRARLALYRACWNLPGGPVACTNVDVLKAVEEAIHDGVDVLSLSLGGLASPFMLPIIDIGLLHAVAKGITVVCAAGNDGPRLHTVDHIVPWIISVAASTMDRSFPSPIMLGNNGTIVGVGNFKSSGGVGAIIAIYPTLLTNCYNWQCIIVDYDLGTQIFSYTVFQSTMEGGSNGDDGDEALSTRGGSCVAAPVFLGDDGKEATIVLTDQKREQ